MSSTTCMVCTQADASRHYGSVCCSGCKGFFRRTVRSRRVYECHYEKRCTIQKEYRNCCRACRFEKCLQAGLNPLLVCTDRGPLKKRREPKPDSPAETEYSPAAGATKVRTSFNSASASEEDDLLPAASATTVVVKQECTDVEVSRANTIASVELEDLPLTVRRTVPKFPSNDAFSAAQYFIYAERICDNVADTYAELNPTFNVDVPASVAFRRPGAICSRYPANWSSQKVFCGTTFLREYLRTIAHFFDWARSIPEVDMLSEHDKEVLITGRCVPCNWLLMCHRSAIDNAPGIPITAGSYMPFNAYSKIDVEVRPLSGVVDVAMADIVKPLQENEVSKAEYALLRVVCFCSPVPSMSKEGSEIIRNAKEKYLNMFSELVHRHARDPAFSKVVQRVSRLMMLLPAAERVGQMDDAALSVMSLFNLAGLQGSLTWDLHVKKCYT
ncbi:NHR-34 protein [Aphelenchoides avenae]|nr:NHR-34 protein [Aphelenchus avenae]